MYTGADMICFIFPTNYFINTNRLFSPFTLPIKYIREQVTEYVSDIFGMVSVYEEEGFWKINVLILVSKKSVVKPLRVSLSKLPILNTQTLHNFFLGRQQRQNVKVPRRFRDWLRPHLQNATDGLVKPKLMNRYPTV